MFKEKTREETISEKLEENFLMDVNPSEAIYTTRINTIVERYILSFLCLICSGGTKDGVMIWRNIKQKNKQIFIIRYNYLERI